MASFSLLLIFSLVQLSICQENVLLSVNDTYPYSTQHDPYGILHTMDSFVGWSSFEEGLSAILFNRLRFLKLKRQLIDSYLGGYAQIMSNSQRESFQSAKTYYDSYKTTRNYAMKLHNLKKYYGSQTFAHFSGQLYQLLQIEKPSFGIQVSGLGSAQWISLSDTFMSMNSLLHIHLYSKYSPEQLSIGFSLESYYESTLTSKNMADIAAFALYRQNFQRSVEWINLASKACVYGEEHSKYLPMYPDLTAALLKLIVQQHNLIESLKVYAGEYLQILDIYYGHVGVNRLTQTALSSWDYLLDIPEYTLFDILPETMPEKQFRELCRGNTFPKSQDQKNLRCYYERNKHPYLYINPVKTELLSESPLIFQFYDIVDDLTTTQLRRQYSSQMTLYELYQVGPEDVETHTVDRTSARLFASEFRRPGLWFFLPEILVGIRIEGTSEPIQYAEYTYGKVLTEHSDVLGGDNISDEELDGIRIEGDRIVTIIHYLELPDIGGETPFCQVGINARQVKGSIVVWFNMWRNGTNRNDVHHGGCPVIHGHKIITITPVRYLGNWDKYPCSLNQYE